jgi:hypothetical protein
MVKTPEHREPHAERHEHHIHQEKSIAEWTLEIGIGLMVLGTLGATSVAAYWTSWQWSAANEQLKTMQDTEQRQLRAYVGIIPGDVENFGSPDAFRLKLVRKNYGMTPAYDMGFTVVGSDIIDPKQPVITGVSGAQGCVKPNFQGLITMFPGAELPLTITLSQHNFSPERIGYVKNGNGTLVFMYWGNICYNDAWNHPHFTDYCWMYKGTDMSAKAADGCLTHNNSN